MNEDPFDDEQGRRYYDRKVKRAEEVLPYLGVAFFLGAVILLIVTFW